MTKKSPVKNPVDNPVENPVENSELLADLQRTRADFENYRKQVDLQKQQAVSAAREATVAAILPLLDQLQLAIATYEKELAPLAKTFEKTLQDFHLQPIVTAENTPFDPSLHEAVMVEDGEGEQELIAATLRPGYYYNGEVLRPAMVKVKRV